MRNRYPGKCFRCGEVVDTGDGHFERYGRGFRVQHAGCAIAYRGTKNDKPNLPRIGGATAKQANQE